MMKVIVTSAGHPERLHTFNWLFKAVDPKRVHVVTHTKEMKQQIRKVCPTECVISATGNKTLIEQRNFGLSLINNGEWFIGIDDNVQKMQQVHKDFIGQEVLEPLSKPPKGFASWREVYRQPLSNSQFDRRFIELRDRCKELETIYGGIAGVENPVFRARKWSHSRFVKSKIFVLKNVPGLQWKGGSYAHDSWLSAYTVANYGRVAVHNYLYPVHRMYEPGGLGKDRRPLLEPLLEEIIKEFPGLVDKAKGANSALRFLLTNQKSIERWRIEHGYLRPPKPSKGALFG